MATFTHGKSTKLYMNGYDLTSYFRQASQSGSGEVAETTSFGKSAKTYIGGLRDGTITAEGMFDRSSGASDAVLAAALNVADSEIAYLPEGDTAGAYGYCLQAEETSYGVSSPITDVVSVSLEAQSSVGTERVVSLRALASATSGGTATSIDEAASSTDGYVGYLQVTAKSGAGTLTVELQDSANNSTWGTVATFSTVTGTSPTSERIAAAGTVRRYVRVVHALTAGTATFWAGIGRKPNNI